MVGERLIAKGKRNFLGSWKYLYAAWNGGYTGVYACMLKYVNGTICKLHYGNDVLK